MFMFVILNGCACHDTRPWAPMGLNGTIVRTGWVEEKRKWYMVGDEWHDSVEAGIWRNIGRLRVF